MTLEPTREELLDVTLLDVLADVGVLADDALLGEAREWCSDPGAWSPDVWHLLEPAAPIEELQERLDFLTRLGMVRRARGAVEITRAGFQMWDGFPWEYYGEEEDPD